jgi:hypothetical protein
VIAINYVRNYNFLINIYLMKAIYYEIANMITNEINLYRLQATKNKLVILLVHLKILTLLI